VGYDLTFAFVDGRLVKTVSDLKLGAAGFAVEPCAGFECELECALEPVIA
jgi:hypothetical protein